MSQALTFLSLPDNEAGISVTASASSWAYGNWVCLTPKVSRDIYVMRLQFQETKVTTADTTYEVLFDIGIGYQGNEVVKAQVPYSFRSDTAVSYYLNPQGFYFPEPFFIPKGSRISIRAANSAASADVYNGIKLFCQTDGKLVNPSSNSVFNNYMFVHGTSGNFTDSIR